MTPKPPAVPAPSDDSVYDLPGDKRLIANVALCRDGDRITIHSGLIRNRIFVARCTECGMGLCDEAEYHPYLACQVFKRTHDSREVWRAMRKAARGGAS